MCSCICLACCDIQIPAESHSYLEAKIAWLLDGASFISKAGRLHVLASIRNSLTGHVTVTPRSAYTLIHAFQWCRPASVTTVFVISHPLLK